jgi:hypothetical protein
VWLYIEAAVDDATAAVDEVLEETALRAFGEPKAKTREARLRGDTIVAVFEMNTMESRRRERDCGMIGDSQAAINTCPRRLMLYSVQYNDYAVHNFRVVYRCAMPLLMETFLL